MDDFTGKTAIINDKIVPAEDIQNFNFAEKTIYEVIRIIDGIPLFLEDHLERLFSSIALLKFAILHNSNYFEKNINTLIKQNNVENGNIKLIVSFREETPLFLFYVCKHFYPSTAMYNDGINTLIFHAERENPNAKNFQSVAQKAKRKIQENNVFEVLYSSSKNILLEGSRSNLFFIKNNELHTAKAEDVLKGITRKYVLEAAKKNNMQILERNIFEKELASFHSAFISGTSPKILPIRTIDMHTYSTENKVLRQLMFTYEQIINTYINNRK